MSNSYQHLIIVATAVIVTGLITVLKLWPYGKDHTFSQHVARHKSAILYYIGLFAVVLPLLLLFIFKWFIPTFNPPLVFGYLIVLAAAAQFACTLVPETGGRKTTAHQMLAYLAADCLFPSTFMIVLLTTASNVARIVAVVSSLAMACIIGIMVWAYFKNHGRHRYLLILQSVYFASFFITLLITTYTK
jgi:hypothetical protein